MWNLKIFLGFFFCISAAPLYSMQKQLIRRPRTEPFKTEEPQQKKAPLPQQREYWTNIDNTRKWIFRGTCPKKTPLHISLLHRNEIIVPPHNTNEFCCVLTLKKSFGTSCVYKYSLPTFVSLICNASQLKPFKYSKPLGSFDDIFIRLSELGFMRMHEDDIFSRLNEFSFVHLRESDGNKVMVFHEGFINKIISLHEFVRFLESPRIDRIKFPAILKKISTQLKTWWSDEHERNFFSFSLYQKEDNNTYLKRSGKITQLGDHKPNIAIIHVYDRIEQEEYTHNKRFLDEYEESIFTKKSQKEFLTTLASLTGMFSTTYMKKEFYCSHIYGPLTMIKKKHEPVLKIIHDGHIIRAFNTNCLYVKSFLALLKNPHGAIEQRKHMRRNSL